MAEPKPQDILRERYGPISREILEISRESARYQAAILGTLKNGPMTVPQLASATQLPADRLFWHVNALRKYGKLKSGDKAEGYFIYSIVEKAKQ